MLEVTEQRLVNNEYVQIHELANCHAGPYLYLRLAF